MKSIFTAAALLFTIAAQAQIERQFSAVIEFSGFSAITDSVTTGDIINWSDPLNGGYLPSQIQAGFRVVDAAGRMYRVTALNSSTFSSANVTMDTTLTAGGTSMFIRYTGSTAPTLTEPSAGNYTLAEPAGTKIRGYDWTGNNADTDGTGDIIITITSADGNELYQISQVINQGNDQIADLPTLGINIEQVESAGQIVVTYTGMSGFGASGFTILSQSR